MYLKDEVKILVTAQIIAAIPGSTEKKVRFNLLDLREMRELGEFATVEMLCQGEEVDIGSATKDTVLVDFTESLGINVVIRIGDLCVELRHRSFRWPTVKRRRRSITPASEMVIGIKRRLR